MSLTIRDILAMKSDGNKIAAVTAYDYPSARLADAAGIDLILVGDSLGTVVQGRNTTLPVTMDQMVYHTQMVARGVGRALLMTDMPFMSYQQGTGAAMENAGRLIAEGGAAAVKLEGGSDAALERVAALVTAGIPVMGHIGLTPQSVHAMGGYRVQGKGQGEAERILTEARALESVGAFSLLLEGIPEKLAKEVTELLSIPTVGIGAGIHCDGQILVWHDLLGLGEGKYPKFVKPYAHLGRTIRRALKSYADEVKDNTFPGPEHTYH
ncbi:MAG: 3-methyl-2-oxobutanoate hydroxymethyltransferase [Nitrospirota bacterium]|nr:3-methyl-2-oxobutanoate hydroxymethyltransferase [Nitrospirota bacterium]